MVKKALRLLSPLAVFFLLIIPYSYFNNSYVVEWFGCGCPKVDEYGNIIHNDFNANDFTFLFWLFVSVCVVAIAFFISKRFLKGWKRALYLAYTLLVSLFITYEFHQALMWN